MTDGTALDLLWQQTQIIEQSHDAIFSIDMAGRVSSWNSSAERLFGYRKEEIFGQRVHVLCAVKPGEPQGEGIFELFLEHGGAVEAKLCRKSGNAFYAHLSLSILKDHEGKNIGMVGYVIDITPRKLAEEGMRESEAKLKSMAANVPGMVFQFVLKTRGKLAFAFVSEGALSVCGLSPEMLLADASGFLQQILPEEQDAFYGSMGESVKRMESWNWEGRIYPPGQGEKWVNWRASPRQLPNGDVLWDGVMLNITESKLAELEIKQSREQLRDLSAYLQTVREEEKAHIAREIHDELGGTLTALKIDAFWLAKKLLPAQAELRDKTDSMVKLIDGAVQATRRITTELRPTILDDLGLWAAIEWQAAEFQNRMGIRCEVNGEAGQETIGDQAAIALFRVFQEALTNVARHAEATQVRVDLRAAGGQISLSIRDNGRGVSEERLWNPTSHGVRGMFERARQLGGKVEIHGAPGEGTTVVVRLAASQKPERGYCND